MNKELFVSSTPHETKVGLVEDDLLAEIYLERENEYTLAGSIYKGRVTRVLPGMQSAFVDIGLERDAFLYVSDFMELEEHDDDLTDVVPANRAVPDMRPQPVRSEAVPLAEGSETEGSVEADRLAEPGNELDVADPRNAEESQPMEAGAEPDSANSGDQNRDRGNYRGRRRRGRGGRRDGRGEGRSEVRTEPRPEVVPETRSEPRSETKSESRGESRYDGRDRGSDRGRDRGSDSRFGRPVEPSRSDFGRSAASVPPPGYTPILLPGESISKYSRLAQTPAAVQQQTLQQQPPREFEQAVAETATEGIVPLARTFPEDEPIFADAQSQAEPLHEEHEVEEHEDIAAQHDEPVESASTSANWNQEFRRSEEVTALPSLGWPGEATAPVDPVEVGEEEVDEEEVSQESHRREANEDEHDRIAAVPEHSDQTPAFAAPGTMEEETIDEDEADTVHYESSSDEGYEEFEEETQSGPGHLNGEAREAVAEIHRTSITGTGDAHPAEGAPAEHEEDSEELELEEAQAEAEAMLDAEARGNGTVDARVEVRAPVATAGYTQRTQRPRPDRPGYDRGPRDRGRRGGGGGDRGRGRFRRRESAPVPLISDLLKEGQEILVQIAKEPIGKKGARITSHIALPGRFLVYMPTVNHTGVSRKISSEEERQRLKRIILSERENGHGGFIVRTAAQSASEEELRADIRFLKGLWQDIKNRAEASKPPALIYHDLNVVERVLRDQVTSDFSVIWVDTESEYERILRFFNRFQPGMVKRVKLYTKETPLFEQFGLKEEMDKALKSKVWLKSGGYIVINQTEALVAIDINTGKYVGKTQRLEDTIVKTNVDAIKEIVRQIRLRDLGGIIIIDFIDMDERRNRQRVMQALEEELRHDRAPSKTLQFNDFGLVAITRKRVKQSLERTIGAPCPYCESTGYVKSVTTVCNEIYVEMRKIAKHLEHEDVMLRVHPDVARELKTNNGRLLNEMEEMTKRTIIVKSDPAVHQQQFDIN
jgi:Rne/Rng family ribonuclease